MHQYVLKNNNTLIWIPFIVAVVLLGLIMSAGLNREIFLIIHHALRDHSPDILWETLTFIGDAGVTPLIMIVFIKKRPDLIWATCWASLMAYFVSHGLKPTVNELRPPAVLEHLDVLGPILKYSSFPSGHATTIFTLVGLLTLGVPTSFRISALIWLLGILVALSRIAVGVHWPIDILAGLFIGWGSALVGLWLAHYSLKNKNNSYYWVPQFMFLVLIVVNLFGQPYGFQELWLLQKVIAVGAGILWFSQTMGWYRQAKRP